MLNHLIMAVLLLSPFPLWSLINVDILGIYILSEYALIYNKTEGFSSREMPPRARLEEIEKKVFCTRSKSFTADSVI